MDTATIYELIGYAASALIVVSLLMASVVKLRVVNLIGALVFTAYGLLVGAFPVALANAAIIVIDVYHLVRLARQRAAGYFEAVEVAPDDALLRRFISFHLDDVRRSQPDAPEPRDDHLAWFVLRDAVPVGAVLATRPVDGVATIELDYVTPAHRDMRAGSAFFTDPAPFAAHGITTVVTTAPTEVHRRYLERVGFRAEDGRYVREVASDHHEAER
ncbi:MAG: hypothetical protein ACLFRD_10150 [Nitriliruptoraceae bacterium]